MNVVRWSPFSEFDNFFQALDRPVRRADWLPLVDIRESADAYQIDVEVPAVAADDLSVNIADGVLTVSGERRAEHESEENDKLHRVERRYGRFVRNFKLPEDADTEAIEAHHRDGVLYLRIPKRAASQSRKIEVKGS